MQTRVIDSPVLLAGTESLKKGIWPTSKPLWLAAIYVFFFIIRPWDQLFPWMATIHFERLYFIFMLIVLFFSQDKQPVPRSSVVVAVVLFLISVGLSGKFAYDPSLSWDSFYVYLTLVIFFFVLLMVIRRPYDLVFLIISYIATMAVYLAKSQWEFFVHGQHRYDMGVVRMVGIESVFGGPNSLAMSIVVSLPMWVFLWTNRQNIISTWPKFYKKWFPRALILYLYLAVSSVILTNSRSGMVSFVFFLMLIALFRGQSMRKKFSYIFLSMFALIALWFVMPEEQKGRLRTVWDPESGPENAQTSAEGRIEGYYAGIAMFQDYPILGVGIGGFVKYRVEKVDGIALNAHNLIGQVLGETGLLGLSTFLFLVVSVLIRTKVIRRMARIRPSPGCIMYEKLAFAIRDSILILFFTGLFGHNLYRFNWLWLAAFSVLLFRFCEDAMRQEDNIS